MNIENARALVPVQTGIQPVKSMGYKGIRRFGHYDSPKDRLVFIGYGSGATDNIYSPLGKKFEDRPATGVIVDIYV